VDRVKWWKAQRCNDFSIRDLFDLTTWNKLLWIPSDPIVRGMYSKGDTLMEKTIGLALNRFNAVPPSLMGNPSGNRPQSEIVVNLASLYHHYFLDTRGREPPDPDLAQFEHLQFLLPRTVSSCQRKFVLQ
jgi:hypothetical protein